MSSNIAKEAYVILMGLYLKIQLIINLRKLNYFRVPINSMCPIIDGIILYRTVILCFVHVYTNRKKVMTLQVQDTSCCSACILKYIDITLLEFKQYDLLDI